MSDNKMDQLNKEIREMENTCQENYPDQVALEKEFMSTSSENRKFEIRVKLRAFQKIKDDLARKRVEYQELRLAQLDEDYPSI